MKINESLKKSLCWAYERSPFYKAWYDEQGFSVESFIESDNDVELPVINGEEYIQKSFFDLITIPMSAVAETCTAVYQNHRFLKARSAQEASADVERTKTYLADKGVNRSSIVALDGLSSMENSEIYLALSMLGANVFYLPENADWREKRLLLKSMGADTIVFHSSALEKYFLEGDNDHLETLFRAIMISEGCRKDVKGNLAAYEERLGVPLYEIVSLPFTTALIDFYRSENGEYVPRDGLLIRRVYDGVILTDTDAVTLPLIGLKTEW